MNSKHLMMMGVAAAMMGGFPDQPTECMPNTTPESPEQRKEKENKIKRVKGLKEFYPGIWALNQKSADRKWAKKNKK